VDNLEMAAVRSQWQPNGLQAAPHCPSARQEERHSDHTDMVTADVGYLRRSDFKMSSNETIGLLVIVLILLIYGTPLIWVLTSGRSHGGAKFGWFLVTVFFSWLGLAAFLISTQAPED